MRRSSSLHLTTNQSMGSLQKYQNVLMCPLGMILMEQPVVINICGHTFEKSSITQALRIKQQCPLCKRVAKLQNLCINFTVKDLITAHKAAVEQKQDINTLNFLSQLSISSKKDINKKVIYKKVQQILKQYIGVIVVNGIQMQTIKKQPTCKVILRPNMGRKYLSLLAKQIFATFHIEVDEDDPDFTIKKWQNRVQFIKSNYLISWYYNGSFYFGQYNYDYNGQIQHNGYVLFISIQKDIYIGQYLNHRFHGQVLKYNISDTYNGQLFNNKRHGKGKQYFTDGQSYSGDFKYDKRDGKGKLYFTDGQSYQGDFKDDKRHGKGKFSWGDRSAWKGDIYQGDYMNDKRHGKGKYFYSDGSTYEGDWNDNKKHGKGKYFYSDGSSYEGDWHDNKRYGKGKYCDASGYTYQGDWKDDQRHGQGKYCDTNGNLFIHDYINGVLKNYQSLIPIRKVYHLNPQNDPFTRKGSLDNFTQNINDSNKFSSFERKSSLGKFTPISENTNKFSLLDRNSSSAKNTLINDKFTLINDKFTLINQDINKLSLLDRPRYRKPIFNDKKPELRNTHIESFSRQKSQSNNIFIEKVINNYFIS